MFVPKTLFNRSHRNLSRSRTKSSVIGNLNSKSALRAQVVISCSLNHGKSCFATGEAKNIKMELPGYQLYFPLKLFLPHKGKQKRTKNLTDFERKMLKVGLRSCNKQILAAQGIMRSKNKKGKQKQNYLLVSKIDSHPCPYYCHKMEYRPGVVLLYPCHRVLPCLPGQPDLHQQI